MIFSPYFWIAIVGLFVVGYVSGCTHEKTAFDEAKASWKADKQARLAAAKAEEEARAQVVSTEQARLEGERKNSNDTLVALQARNKALDVELSKLRLSQRLADRVRDSISAANASPPEGTPQGAAKDTPAAAGSPEGSTSEGALAGWIDKVAFLYNDCRTTVIGWNKFWDAQAGIP